MKFIIFAAMSFTLAAQNTTGSTQTTSNNGVPLLDFEPVFGIGITKLLDDVVDFELKDGLGDSPDQVLLVKNDSITRATGILGFIVRPEGGPKWLRRGGFLISATFSEAQGSEQTVGVTFGLAYRVMKNVNIFGGWTRKQGEEMSYGFSRAAVQYVKDNPANATLQQLYGNQLQVNPGSKDSLRRYDGFRITQDFKQRYFAGSPMTQSYNSALVFGLAIPLEILGKLKGKDSTTSSATQ